MYSSKFWYDVPVQSYADNYSIGYHSVRRCRLSDWQPLCWPAYGDITVTRIGRGIVDALTNDEHEEVE